MDRLQRWITTYDEHVLWDLFDDATLSRGLHYAQDGRVMDITPAREGFYARVRGSRRNVYHTQVRVHDLHADLPVSVHCSCPVGVFCKHGVAAIAARVNELKRRQSATAPNTSSEIALWLDDLQQAAQQTRKAASDRIVYILEPGDRASLTVTPYKTRPRKDGRYGALHAYRGDGRTGAGFLQPVDERVLPLLHLSRQSVDVASLPIVLAELANTERAHVGDTSGPALNRGPERAARLEWVGDDTGAQRLCARLEDDDGTVQVVAGQPPWYLDPTSGQTGPVALNLPERLAVTLLQAPAVPPEAMASLHGPLQELDADLPLPQPPEEKTVAQVTPTPCLHLTMRPLFADLPYGDDLDDERMPVASVSFDYDGIDVPATRDEDTVTVHRDGVLWHIQRKRSTERNALKGLADQGLRRMDIPGDAVLVPGEEQDWLDIVVHTVPVLRAQGWRIHIASDFPYRLVEADAWYADLDDSDGNAWFDLELGVEVEGERHSLVPILIRLIQSDPEAMSQKHLDAVDLDASMLVDLGDGRLVPMPARRLVPMLRTLSELYDPRLTGNEAALTLPAVRAAAVTELEDDTGWSWRGGEAVLDFGRRLSALERITPATPPAGLTGSLREYQAAGVGWMQALAAQQLGGILADDMGLGKTIQVLAHLLLEKETGRADHPSLVVAPRSLLFNWEREAERFAPGLRVLRLHGPERHAAMAHLADYDLILTTYALVPRDVDALANQPLHLLVLDEAQAVKNPRAKAAQAVRRLTAQQRLCLTGTPLENHLGDLWAQFDFLLPGLLGDATEFRRLFRRPIEKDGDHGRQQALQRRIQPFLLRRTKQAIARELPAKTEIRREAELTGAQRDLYETVRAAMHQRVRDEVARRGLERSQVVVLDALLKLRQVCCDPRLLKLDAARKVNRSAKLEMLLDHLRELVAEGRRILLFSQFTSMLTLIEEALTGTGIDYVKLTGQTRKREERIERFQSGAVPLFLISLKAGGTGLNLTAADTVIHYDPWWNPAVMQQASDRAHRIGQTQPVFVYNLLTSDTVEEKIMALQQRKAELGEWLLGGGEGRTAALEMADVEALFAPLD